MERRRQERKQLKILNLRVLADDEKGVSQARCLGSTQASLIKNVSSAIRMGINI